MFLCHPYGIKELQKPSSRLARLIGQIKSFDRLRDLKHRMPIAWADNNRLAKLLLLYGTGKYLQLFFKKNTFFFAHLKNCLTFALAIEKQQLPRWRNRQTRWSQTPVGQPIPVRSRVWVLKRRKLKSSLRFLFFYIDPKKAQLQKLRGKNKCFIFAVKKFYDYET